MGSLLKSREILSLFRFLVRLELLLKMDFPYKQLTPKGQIKVNEGQMDSLFDLEKDEDFNEDNIIRDILCLSTIDKISQADIDKYKVEKNYDCFNEGSFRQIPSKFKNITRSYRKTLRSDFRQKISLIKIFRHLK